MSDSTEYESPLSVDEWGTPWGAPGGAVKRWIRRRRADDGESESD